MKLHSRVLRPITCLMLIGLLLLQCVPAVAAGRMTPEACWEQVMALAPFEE